MVDEEPFRGLGKALRELRAEKGLTLKEAGSLAGVSFSNLAAYERGDGEPTLKVLSRILAAYKVDLHELADRMEPLPSDVEDVEEEPADMADDDPILDSVRRALKRLGFTPPSEVEKIEKS
jgi:transcriptional regulator with XRE-family HTH domain